MTRPCKLQINQSGAWRDAIRFDLDDVDVEALQVAAANLVQIAAPSGRTTLRIATADSLPMPLISWTAQKGWTER